MLQFLWKIKSAVLSLFNSRTVGARALVITDNQILLVKHSYVPKWHTIGGGIDKGETPMEAVQRELWEEAGIQCISPPQLFGVYHNNFEKRDDYVVLYIVEQFTQVSVESPEILEARWFAFHDLPEEISPATQRRIDEYLGARQRQERW